MMKAKATAALVCLCLVLFSCAEGKPGRNVEPAKPKRAVNRVIQPMVKRDTRPYKILVPFFNYRSIDPEKVIDNSWVELYQTKSGYFVDKASYQIEKGYDDCIGETVKAVMGKRNTILFINHLPVMKGKVAAADLEICDTCDLAPGTQSSFTFGKKHYTLEAKAKTDEDGRYKDYCLLLNGERIVKESEVDGAYFRVLFAGDIDGDGKLDLILSAPGNYEELRVVLLLSSCAASHHQMGKVAEVEDDFSC